MKRALGYLRLPSEVSPFERSYLARTTRIGLLWIAAHVPVLMAVAAATGTGVLKALLLTSLVGVGPLLAVRFVDNPRVATRLLGVASMCLSGLLVHFGQGPMQIEMHFHFFVSIALLAVFADPLVIVIAAATAALHHLLLWVVAPASVFNYEATIWTVAVHSLFVVVESVAACFVARTFFDNVIGLDRIVRQRTAELEQRAAEMKLVLDNVDQGLVVVESSGEVSDEESAALAALLGPTKSGEKVWSRIERVDAEAGASAKIFWEMLVEGMLPPELVFDQLPKRVTRGARTLDLQYKPLYVAGEIARVLLVVTDVTAEIQRELAEVEQRETLAIFEQSREDRDGMFDFRSECRAIIRAIADEESSLVVVNRALHTLKGNCGLRGLTSLARLCHDVETRTEESGAISEADRAEIGERWAGVERKLQMFVGEQSSAKLQVDRDDYRAAIRWLREGRDAASLATALESWELESTQARLEVLGRYAMQVATRLEKGPIDVVVESNGVKFAPGALGSLWATLTHLVRNAVDHGIESADERARVGKRDAPRIDLSTRLEREELIIAVSDNGAGIDWDAVRERATGRDLPAATDHDLERALFADGLSTRDEATDVSGRGVGMSAVLAECERRQGTLRVVWSERGVGTTIEVRLPFRAVGIVPASEGILPLARAS